MLWDLYQHYRIRQLDQRLDRLQSTPRTDGLARDQVVRLEEKLAGDGQSDGKMSPKAQRCPKCEAMMSPKFGRCLFCGYRAESVSSFT